MCVCVCKSLGATAGEATWGEREIRSVSDRPRAVPLAGLRWGQSKPGASDLPQLGQPDQCLSRKAEVYVAYAGVTLE